jgi:hypothetical protein
MKKFAKMSLAAAVAVAGLSTTASAGALEDAIKGVQISGQVTAGYNVDSGWDGATGALETNALPAGANSAANKTTENEWEYDLDISMMIPVNDMITANVAF